MMNIYFCKNMIDGTDYTFSTKATLSIGLIIKDEDGFDNIIIDCIEERIKETYIPNFSYELMRGLSL